MKCIYFTDVLKGVRCSKNAFGTLGGNSYCRKHLDLKQSNDNQKPLVVPHKPSKGPIDTFRENYGRSPDKWELIAMI